MLSKKLIFILTILYSIKSFAAAEYNFLESKVPLYHSVDFTNIVEDEDSELPRISCCKKIGNFFSAIPKKLKHKFFSILKTNPKILNIVSTTPLITEALSGYSLYTINNLNAILLFIGFTMPILSTELLYNCYKYFKKNKCGCSCDLIDLSQATKLMLMGLLPVIGLEGSIILFIKIRDLSSFLYALIVGIPMLSCACCCIIGPIQRRRENQPCKNKFLSGLLLPISIYVVGPYKQFKKFLKKEIKDYFLTVGDADENFNAILQNFIPVNDLVDIVYNYSGELEYATNVISNNRESSVFSLPNESLLDLIYEYAEPNENEQFDQVFRDALL